MSVVDRGSTALSAGLETDSMLGATPSYPSPGHRQPVPLNYHAFTEQLSRNHEHERSTRHRNVPVSPLPGQPLAISPVSEFDFAYGSHATDANGARNDTAAPYIERSPYANQTGLPQQLLTPISPQRAPVIDPSYFDPNLSLNGPSTFYQDLTAPFPGDHGHREIITGSTLLPQYPPQTHLDPTPSPQTSSATSPPNDRKRRRITDDEDEGKPEVSPVHDGPVNKFMRLPGACSHCKRLKMKCEFLTGADSCVRCTRIGYSCVVEPRKQGPRVNKNRELLAVQASTIQKLEAALREKDEEISALRKRNAAASSPGGTSRRGRSLSSTTQSNGVLSAWLEKARQSIKRGLTSFMPHRAFLDEDDDEPPSSAALPTSQPSVAPQLHSIPINGSVYGTIARMAIATATAKSGMSPTSTHSDSTREGEGKKGEVGIADEDYFTTDFSDTQEPPQILVSGLIEPHEVEELFKIFFDRINIFVSLLDPVLYTPETTFARSPFLFTVVCAVASKYYTKRPDLHEAAMEYAKDEAASTINEGWKTVEACQAYILLSTYPVPARRWEEDRAWLYLGIAIRMAMDLNLHVPTKTKATTEVQEREILNRERTWLICHNLDRSSSTQFGRPWTIQDTWFTRNAGRWWKSSKYNMSYDLHLCRYTELLRIVSRFHAETFSDKTSMTGLNKNIDMKATTLRYNEELENWKAEVSEFYKTASDSQVYGCVFRVALMPYLVDYSRLVILSFGFQQAFQRDLPPGDVILTRCVEAASSVVQIFVERLAPSGLLRYSPDGHFVFASFAAAFLLKLFRPRFSLVIDAQQRTDILALVKRLISVLSSTLVAIDDRHAPILYARFLSGVVDNLQSIPVPVPIISAPTRPQLDDSFHGFDLIASPLEVHNELPSDTTSPIPAPITDMLDDVQNNQNMLAALNALSDPSGVFWSNLMLPGWSVDFNMLTPPPMQLTPPPMHLSPPPILE